MQPGEDRKVPRRESLQNAALLLATFALVLWGLCSLLGCGLAEPCRGYLPGALDSLHGFATFMWRGAKGVFLFWLAWGTSTTFAERV
jgi:hypothetical protein